MIKLPDTARGWQWMQHFTGGLYQICLTLMGVAFGAGEVITGTILAIITFLINRASSEIAYQVQVRIIKEHTSKR